MLPLGQPPHGDGPLDRVAAPGGAGAGGGLDPEVTVGGPHDRGDSEVDARGQALVEAHLLLAEVLAPLERGVVEEAQVHRLLDLVDALAGEEEQRDVRLQEIDLGDRRHVGPGAQELLDQTRGGHAGVNVAHLEGGHQGPKCAHRGRQGLPGRSEGSAREQEASSALP